MIPCRFGGDDAAESTQDDGIKRQVRLTRNAQALYHNLVDESGFTANYESVKRFVRACAGSIPKQFDRLEFAPSEEARLDYGEGALTAIRRAVVTAGRGCSR